MADDEQQEVEQQQPDTKEGAEQAKALNAVQDNAPEKQLDESRVQKALASLAASQKENKEAARKRERELAAVKVSPGDIALIAAEMEVEAKVAERRLREAGGDVRAALTSFL